MDVFNVYLILLTLQIAHTLECYDCAATSEYACLSKPKLKRCPTSYQACMTISYTYPNTASKDTPADESVFIKSCVKSEKDCARLCKNILSTGSKKCQWDCCTGNRCNGRGYIIQESAAMRSGEENLQPKMLRMIAYLSMLIMVVIVLWPRL